MRLRLLFLFALLNPPIASFAQNWTQQGSGINGQTQEDGAGVAVSMPDARTIAIGAPGSDDGGVDNGQVRVFSWSGNAWQPKGASIAGEGGNFGEVLTMPDSNTVGVAAPFALDTRGQVRVYGWDGSGWVQMGAPIDGTAIDGFAGTSLSMPSATMIAIGAPQADNVGVVRVYRWNGTAWIQRGSDILGTIGGGHAGGAVSMPDTNTVALGEATYGAGAVRVYFWNGADWSQKGADIIGTFQNDAFGSSVSMPDANTLVAGAPNNGDNGIAAGQVRTFRWNISTWEQKGAAITGQAFNRFGTTVSMPDSSTLSAGATGNFWSSTDTGYVRVFAWNGSAWSQKGSVIEGEEVASPRNYALCMPDDHTIGIGAVSNATNGVSAGQSRVYVFDEQQHIIARISPLRFSLYPIPAHDQVTLDLVTWLASVTVTVRNAMGEILSSGTYHGLQRVTLGLPHCAGMYLIEVRTAEGRTTMILPRD